MTILESLGLAFSYSPQAMIVTDNTGLILATNHAADALLGLNSENRGDGPLNICSVLNCRPEIANGNSPSCEFFLELLSESKTTLHLSCKKGENKPWIAEITGVPLPEIPGSPKSVLIMLHDVSKHVELRRHFEEQVRQWKQQAITDALTGLGNRFRLREEWNRMVTTVQSENEHSNGVVQATICMLDVDNMKNINDGCGHDVGDKVLQHIANLLRSYTRQTDIAIRYGGDEFLLLLPHTRLSQAQGLMRRLGRLMSGLNEFLDIDVDISVSYGLAELGPGDTLEDILIKADKAMYRQKLRRSSRHTTLRHMNRGKALSVTRNRQLRLSAF